MKKRDWLIVIGLVFVIWGIDQATKVWAVESIVGFTFYGPLGLVLHRNPGAMLGMFADLPPVLRIVSLSTGGAFLIFIWAAIQYLLPKKTIVLRTGMSILLGGILGNVTDRIIWGSVVDFLVIGSPSISSPAFNFADAIQWVGYAMVVYTLISEGKQLWPSANERTKIWVKPAFQLKYIAIIISIGVAFTIISGVFSYTYLRVTIDDLIIGRSSAIEKKFILPFLITYSVISSGFIITLFLIGRVLSHRMAGPVYAFELFLDDITAGKDRSLRLRAGDEFAHLEELGEKIRKQLKTHFKPVADEEDSESPHQEKTQSESA